MQGDVDLVLDVEVGVRQEGEQVGEIGRDQAPQVGLDQGMPIEGCGGEDG
jgi:hypothetical protein